MLVLGQITARAFIPTDLPEADDTIVWDSTPNLVAEIQAAGETGLRSKLIGIPRALLLGR